MKTITLFIILCAITVFNFGCKKKNTENSSNSSDSNTSGSSAPAAMTANVNGNAWACGTFLNKPAVSIFQFGNTFAFSAQTKVDSPYTVIQLSFPYVGMGSHYLGVSPFYAKYRSEDFTYFTARTGTIDILNLDTTGPGSISKFKANFSFVTDTIGGKSYTITGGVVDYIK